ncbi:MAG: type III PLP-dependent enzyme [Chloroflexi bacterium]|nr:type III PLP-dependent enzyme [Chloroflexota bacterium]
MADGRLSLQKAVGEILEREGTPALVMDKRAIRERYREFCREFSKARIYYALKANPHPGLVELLHEIGCQFEISSQGELELLLGMGISIRSIISSNPVKDPAFIRSAYASGIHVFAFDSFSEVEKLSKLALGSQVYVRLSVPNEGSEWPLSKKFGVEAEQAAGLLAEAQERGLKPQGIAFHVGSQCTRAATWAKAIQKSRAVWDMAASKGVELKALNIGGGFPIEYTRSVPSLAEIARVVEESLARAFPGGVEVLVAPGRALVGDSGILGATVVAKAEREGERWLYLDVGVFNGLMEAVGGIRYSLRTSKRGRSKKWVLAGPSCDSFDVICNEAELPEVGIGDRVYFLSAGAYTTAYASQFDGFPIPKVYFIE